MRQRSYVAGALDGMFLAPLFGAPKAKLEWIENCTVGMTDAQIAAMVSKYLTDHPETWHQQAHIAVYAALKAPCTAGEK